METNEIKVAYNFGKVVCEYLSSASSEPNDVDSMILTRFPRAGLSAVCRISSLAWLHFFHPPQSTPSFSLPVCPARLSCRLYCLVFLSRKIGGVVLCCVCVCVVLCCVVVWWCVGVVVVSCRVMLSCLVLPCLVGLKEKTWRAYGTCHKL
jgi:hypothetical protein